MRDLLFCYHHLSVPQNFSVLDISSLIDLLDDSALFPFRGIKRHDRLALFCIKGFSERIDHLDFFLFEKILKA